MEDIAKIRKATGVKEVYDFDDAVFVYFDNLNDAKFFVTGICSEGKFKLNEINVMVRIARKGKKNVSGNHRESNAGPEKNRDLGEL